MCSFIFQETENILDYKGEAGNHKSDVACG